MLEVNHWKCPMVLQLLLNFKKGFNLMLRKYERFLLYVFTKSLSHHLLSCTREPNDKQCFSLKHSFSTYF